MGWTYSNRRNMKDVQTNKTFKLVTPYMAHTPEGSDEQVRNLLDMQTVSHL